MEKLIFVIGCGRIELVLKQSAVYFVVVKFRDIFEKIIPLFDKHPIKGIKALDYSDFKKVANLMYNKQHLTEEGFRDLHYMYNEGYSRYASYHIYNLNRTSFGITPASHTFIGGVRLSL
jgi:hypothetical protein